MDMLSYSSHLECEEVKCPTCSLFLSFSSSARLWIRMYWGQMLILQYLYIDCISLILDWRLHESLFGFIFQWLITRTKLKTSFSHKHYKIFSAISVAFLLFLNSHDITCQICTFSFSILGAWDHRLNDDAHSFTTEIKMTNECAL